MKIKYIWNHEPENRHYARIQHFGFSYHRVAKPTCCIKRCGKYLGVGNSNDVVVFAKHGWRPWSLYAVFSRAGWNNTEMFRILVFGVEFDWNDFLSSPPIQEKGETPQSPVNTSCMHQPWKLGTQHWHELVQYDFRMLSLYEPTLGGMGRSCDAARTRNKIKLAGPTSCSKGRSFNDGLFFNDLCTCWDKLFWLEKLLGHIKTYHNLPQQTPSKHHAELRWIWHCDVEALPACKQSSV